MNRHLKYGLVLLLGLMAQVVVFAVDVGDIPYTVWHGRRGGDGKPIDLYQQIDPSYVLKDEYSMQFSCSEPFGRPDMSSYAVISGHDGDATAAQFKYTPTADNPLLYIYFSMEIYVGYGSHDWPFLSIMVYDNGIPVGCSFYHMEQMSGVQPGFEICANNGVFCNLFRPWDVLSYDMSDRIGHELTIEVISTCCSNVRCWSRMYVAFEKDKPKDICSTCDSTILVAPSYSNPTWHRGSSTGPIVGTDETLVVHKEDWDDYYCAPSNSCSSPLLLGKAMHINGDFAYRSSCSAGGDTVYLQNKSYMYYSSTPGTHLPCDTLVWDFGDGRTSSDPNLSYVVYNKDDNIEQYTISLHVGSKGFGCDTTVTQVVPFGLQNVTNMVDSICQEDLPYIWRGRPYTVSGDYTDTLVASTGCDSVLHLLLTVLDTTVSTTSYSICEGETIRWNGKSYSQAGTYRDTLVNAAGCDSLLTLHIQYKDCSDPKDTTDIPLNPMPFLVYRDTIDTILCVGDYLEWHGKTYTEDGTYAYDTGYYWFGWDSVYWVIKLKLKDCCPTPISEVTDTIRCETEVLQWHGMDIDGSQTTYFDTLRITRHDTLTCDSICYTLNVFTRYSRDSVERDTVCEGDAPPIWHGQVLSSAGPYYDTLFYSTEPTCDSIRITHYHTILSPTASDTADVICRAEQPYLWHGKQLTDAGTLKDTLVNAAGCDSIITLTLTVNEPSVGDTTAHICAGDDFTWYGIVSHDGDIITLDNTVGCDSVVTLHLITDMPTASDTAAVICRAELPYLWHGKELNDAGTLEDTLVNSVGCDSIITLTLSVNEASIGDTTARVCQGDDFMWYGVIAHDGDQMTFTNAAGCDSVVTLRLITKMPSASDTADVICRAELPYFWHGKQLTDAGTLKDTLVNAVGCDSIITLTLTVNEPSIGDTTAHICAGDDFTWYGIVSHDGDVIRFDNSIGCDSVVTLHIVTNPVYHPEVNLTICDKQLPYTWNGITCTQADDYVFDGTTILGCDSIVTLHLSVDVFSASDTAATICRAELPYLWHGKTLTDSGSIKDTLTNVVGCDSIITLTLTVNEASVGDTTAHICQGDDFTWYGTVSHDGDKMTFTNAVGCDSIVTLRLITDNPSTSDTADVICRSSLPYMWHGKVLTDAGTLEDTLVNSVGCDSIVTLTLSVNEASVGDTTAHICAGDDFMWYGVLAHDGDQMTFTNAVGCDSIVTLRLVMNPTYHQEVNLTVCNMQLPYTWNGITCTQADDYIFSGSTVLGCDSIVTLHLAVDAFSASDTAASICRADLPYIWHEKVLTDAGSLKDTLVNAVDCDSIITLTLTVNEATTGDTTAHVCAGDDFMWYGVVAHDGDQITFTNAAGCDSVVTLHLAIGNCCPDTVHRESAISLCDTLLPYTWTTYRDIPITQVGSYTDTLRNAAGCDSIIYYLQLSTYDCCAPLRAAIRIPDVCADAATMDIIIDSLQGSLYAYRVHYTNAAGNTMPFRDTTVTGLSYIKGEPFIITLPVPNDPNDRRNYPRPDTYALSLTLYNTCGDSIQWVSVPFNVLFPSWILDQHWDDVIALLNDRYNGGYTFSDIKWLRDGEILPGEYEPYIYLPHQLWTSEEHTYQPYTYQALLTRTDDGKSIMTCPMIPYHIDSTNILTEPYVAVTPTYVPHENPVVHVMTNTRGTYWVYDMTGKLLQTADYEPCYHGVFEIWLNPTQTIYILVFTPRNEAKPLQKKYRAIKVVMK